MKTGILLFCLFLFGLSGFAQYSPKTTKQREGSSVKKCFHKNGKVSTLEIWDKDQRNGNLKGFNNQRKELFSLSLRRYGGHASARLTYYPNGQVQSVYYSDAPDGGIQYYHSTMEFDKLGRQTSFREDKYPDELRPEAPFGN